MPPSRSAWGGALSGAESSARRRPARRRACRDLVALGPASSPRPSASSSASSRATIPEVHRLVVASYARSCRHLVQCAPGKGTEPGQGAGLGHPHRRRRHADDRRRPPRRCSPTATRSRMISRCVVGQAAPAARTAGGPGRWRPPAAPARARRRAASGSASVGGDGRVADRRALRVGDLVRGDAVDERGERPALRPGSGAAPRSTARQTSWATSSAVVYAPPMRPSRARQYRTSPGRTSASSAAVAAAVALGGPADELGARSRVMSSRAHLRYRRVNRTLPRSVAVCLAHVLRRTAAQRSCCVSTGVPMYQAATEREGSMGVEVRVAGADEVLRWPAGLVGRQPDPARRRDLRPARTVRHRQVGVPQDARRPAPARPRLDLDRGQGPAPAVRARAVRGAQAVRRAVPGRRAVRLDEHLRQRGVPAARAHPQVRVADPGASSPRSSTWSAWSARRRSCPARSPAACASGPAWPARSCSTRRSSCSTSPTPGWTRSAPRTSTSSSSTSTSGPGRRS